MCDCRRACRPWPWRRPSPRRWRRSRSTPASAPPAISGCRRRRNRCSPARRAALAVRTGEGSLRSRRRCRHGCSAGGVRCYRWVPRAAAVPGRCGGDRPRRDASAESSRPYVGRCQAGVGGGMGGQMRSSSRGSLCLGLGRGRASPSATIFARQSNQHTSGRRGSSTSRFPCSQPRLAGPHAAISKYLGTGQSGHQTPARPELQELSRCRLAHSRHAW
jgi:hypothetical protein